LDVGGLRVDRGREAGGDEHGHAVDLGDVGGGELGGRFVGDVAPVVAQDPGVAGDGEAQAAVFAQDGGAVGLQWRRTGAGVVVNVEDVAVAGVGPAGGAVDEARRVPLFHEIDDGLGPGQVVLA